MTSERNPDYKYKPLLGGEIARRREVGLQLGAAWLRSQHGVSPRLEILSNNETHLPSQQYVNLKVNKGRRLGFDVNSHFVETSEELNELTREFNTNPNVHGIMVQLPLRDGENPESLVNRIAPGKDVDGLGHASAFDPATPSAILKLLESHEIDYRHVPVALVGRGRLVGAPLYRRMIENGAEHVDVVEEHTGRDERDEILNRAFIVISAVGRKVLDVTSFDDYTSPKVIIDAGTAGEGDKVVGDVTDALRERAPEKWYMTDPQGGVGPLTVNALLANTLRAAEMQVGNR